jgi:hypothetical protein
MAALPVDTSTGGPLGSDASRWRANLAEVSEFEDEADREAALLGLSPSAVRCLDTPSLERLAADIRSFLVGTVTGPTWPGRHSRCIHAAPTVGAMTDRWAAQSLT